MNFDHELNQMFPLASDRHYNQVANHLLSVAHDFRYLDLHKASRVAINEGHNGRYRSNIIRRMNAIQRNSTERNSRVIFGLAQRDAFDDGWYAYVGCDGSIRFSKGTCAPCA